MHLSAKCQRLIPWLQCPNRQIFFSLFKSVALLWTCLSVTYSSFYCLPIFQNNVYQTYYNEKKIFASCVLSQIKVVYRWSVSVCVCVCGCLFSCLSVCLFLCLLRPLLRSFGWFVLDFLSLIFLSSANKFWWENFLYKERLFNIAVFANFYVFCLKKQNPYKNIYFFYIFFCWPNSEP